LLQKAGLAAGAMAIQMDECGETPKLIVFSVVVITDEISQDFEHALNVPRMNLASLRGDRGLWKKNIVNLDEKKWRKRSAAREI